MTKYKCYVMLLCNICGNKYKISYFLPLRNLFMQQKSCTVYLPLLSFSI